MTLRSTRSPSVVRTKNSYSYISSPCLNTVKLHTVDVIYMIARNSWNKDANEMDRCSPFYNARLPLCFLAKFLHPFEMCGILKPRYVLESCIIAQEEARFLKKKWGSCFVREDRRSPTLIARPDPRWIWTRGVASLVQDCRASQSETEIKLFNTNCHLETASARSNCRIPRMLGRERKENKIDPPF